MCQSGRTEYIPPAGITIVDVSPLLIPTGARGSFFKQNISAYNIQKLEVIGPYCQNEASSVLGSHKDIS